MGKMSFLDVEIELRYHVSFLKLLATEALQLNVYDMSNVHIDLREACVELRG